MKINSTKRHAQLPNGMSENNLTPQDQLVYAVLKYYDLPSGCFLDTLSETIHQLYVSVLKDYRLQVILQK